MLHVLWDTHNNNINKGYYIETTIERINTEGNFNTVLESSNPWLISYITLQYFILEINLTALKVKEGGLGLRGYKM